MTGEGFEAFWDRLLKGKAGDALLQEKVTMSVREFRRLLLLSYREGKAAGIAGKSIFDQVFGKSNI